MLDRSSAEYFGEASNVCDTADTDRYKWPPN